jgi:prepilin-type processing-associated H-X9-DG protein
MQDVLPHLEQEALFEQFDAFMSAGHSALSFPANTTVVPTLMCPADPTSPKLKTWNAGGGAGGSQGFSGNYVLCAGDGSFNPTGPGSSAALNGMFYALSQTRLGDVSDGTSNTALSSELILSPDAIDNDIRGRYYNPPHGGTLFSTRVPPNSAVPDQFGWCSSRPVPQAPCVATGTNMFISARSYHTGGANLGLADGSVRFVSNGADPTAFRATGSRNGGEALGDY